MQFLYPSFLWALTALAIPVAIHLFNFRRFKKVYFSDIRFLKEVQVQTDRQRKLKHLLALLARMLALAFLVFAFAQPVSVESIQSPAGMRSVSIFIDNSFSMENVNTNGALFEEARKAAREIAMSHSATDRFQILNNDFESRHQRFMSREEFLSALDEIKIGSAVKTISEIYDRAKDLMSTAETDNRNIFIVSDFQKSICNIGQVDQDTGISTVLVKIPSLASGNLIVDSCWFETPVIQLNRPAVLKARIINRSDNNLENIPARLVLNGSVKSPTTFNIDKGAEQTIEFSFLPVQAGRYEGEVSLTDYPVTFDDQFYFSFFVPEVIPVACVYNNKSTGETTEDPSRPLRALLSPDSLFDYAMYEVLKLDYSSLNKHRVIFLGELDNISSGLASELKRFIYDGGSLVVFPGTKIDTASYNLFLKSVGAAAFGRADTGSFRVSKVNFESREFNDVFDKRNDNLDLPACNKVFRIQAAYARDEEKLLELQNGDAFFTRFPYESGNVYLSAVPLTGSWSNFSQHAIFVPLIYNLIIGSIPQQRLFYISGRDRILITPAHQDKGETIYHLTDPKGADFIPEEMRDDQRSRINVHDGANLAGHYRLSAEKDTIASYSFNYDRRESILESTETEELEQLVDESGLGSFSVYESGASDVGKALSSFGSGKSWWKWCLALALVFLAAETLVLRLLKD